MGLFDRLLGNKKNENTKSSEVNKKPAVNKSTKPEVNNKPNDMDNVINNLGSVVDKKLAEINDKKESAENDVKTAKTTTRTVWTFDTPQEYEYKLRYLASNGMLEEADKLWQEAVEHYPENKMQYTAIIGFSAKR